MATRMSSIPGPSGCILVPLREGANFTLYGGRQHGNLSPVLRLVSVAEQLSPRRLRSACVPKSRLGCSQTGCLANSVRSCLFHLRPRGLDDLYSPRENLFTRMPIFSVLSDDELRLIILKCPNQESRGWTGFGFRCYGIRQRGEM